MTILQKSGRIAFYIVRFLVCYAIGCALLTAFVWLVITVLNYIWN